LAIRISIPYGAIKSELEGITECSAGKFQFLMVRLKGKSSLIILEILMISIPYGAIKSFISIIKIL